jgi:hypothetical protein
MAVVPTIQEWMNPAISVLPQTLSEISAIARMEQMIGFLSGLLVGGDAGPRATFSAAAQALYDDEMQTSYAE